MPSYRLLIVRLAKLILGATAGKHLDASVAFNLPHGVAEAVEK